MSRRRHPKIATFPADIQEMVNDLLAKGATYREIANRLKELGHPVSHASVGRYGLDFLARLVRFKFNSERATALLSASGKPLVTEEAASQAAAQMIFDWLMKLDALGDETDPLEVVKALSRLQTSSAGRERLRIQWRKEQAEAAAKVAAEVTTKARSNGLSEAVIREIEETILGLGK